MLVYHISRVVNILITRKGNKGLFVNKVDYCSLDEIIGAYECMITVHVLALCDKLSIISVTCSEETSVNRTSHTSCT